MANDLSDDQWAKIDLDLAAGRKIDAIRLHREFSGSDLKGAKDAVEAHLAELLKKHPTRYAAAKTGRGCMPVLLLVCAASFYLLVRMLT